MLRYRQTKSIMNSCVSCQLSFDRRNIRQEHHVFSSRVAIRKELSFDEPIDSLIFPWAETCQDQNTSICLCHKTLIIYSILSNSSCIEKIPSIWRGILSSCFISIDLSSCFISIDWCKQSARNRCFVNYYYKF